MAFFLFMKVAVMRLLKFFNKLKAMTDLARIRPRKGE